MVPWSTLGRHLTTILLSSLIAGCQKAVTVSEETKTGWSVDTIPALILGKSNNPNDGFTEVVGAARGADGKILVVDEGQFTLKLFDSAGKLLAASGRNGTGPGEMNFPVRVNRCGDSLFILDGGRGLVSVFMPDGSFVRTLRYRGPSSSPFSARSSCNGAAQFIHQGWHESDRTDAPTFRTVAPVWLARSGNDSVDLLGTFPDEELWQKKTGPGVTRGPLPLGRRTVVAAGRIRFYLGLAERYEILVFDLDGKPVDTIQKDMAPVPTSAEDIEAFLDNRVGRLTGFGMRDPKTFYHDAPFPKELPPYDAMVVDQADNLWVRSSQQGNRATATWTVFDNRGRELTTIELPTGFDVYEIGEDYLLGRYPEPDSGIPEVRLYRLERR